MSSLNPNSTSSNVDAINALKHSRVLFIQVWSFAMFSFGIVGHILSIYVFTRRSLNTNPCSQYFLRSAMVGLAVVCINVPLRLLQDGFNIDAFATSSAMCRILTWILNSMKALPSWIIILACADRFLCSSSSANTRAWSSIRVVTPATSFTALIVGLSYIHVIIYSQLSAASGCAFPPGTYKTFLGIFNFVVLGVGPSFCMFTFGLLTIRNVHRRGKRVAPNSVHIGNQNQNEPQQRYKAKDRQLMRMMIFQCIFFILTSTPSSVNFCYSSAISNQVANALQTARLSLVSGVATYLSLAGPCLSFYVFTLSSQLFRRELIHLFSCSSEQRK